MSQIHDSSQPLYFTISEEYITRLPFNCANIKTGPLLILDQLTLYVPYVYSNTSNVSFWLKVKEETYEIHMDDVILPHSGQNIYLRLNETINESYVIFIKSNDEHNTEYVKSCNQFVPYYKNLNEPSENPEYTIDGKRRIILKKCCEYAFVNNEGCADTGNVEDTKFKDDLVKIYVNNYTHFDDQPLRSDQVHIRHVVDRARCKNDEILLSYNYDEVCHLSNGSLLLPNTLIGPRSYCYVNNFLLICTRYNEPPSSGYYTVLITFFSFISLASTFLVMAIYSFLPAMRENLKSKLILCLSIVLFFQISFLLIAHYVDESSCIIVGNIYQFFEIMSFGILAVYVYETQADFKDVLNRVKKAHKRVRYYIKIVLLYAVIVLIMLACSRFHPSLPKYMISNKCNLEEASLRGLLYQIPVSLGIIVAIVYMLIYLRLFITEKDGLHAKDRKMQKGILINIMLIMCIMIFSWTIQIFSFYIPDITNALVLVIMSQLPGIILLIVTVFHKPLYKKMCNDCRKKKNKVVESNGNGNSNSNGNSNGNETELLDYV